MDSSEPRFVERPAEEAPWEAGFAAVFAREIAPGLKEQEAARRKAVALFWKLEAAVLGVALVAGLILYWLEVHWLVYAVLVPALALFFGWAVAKLPRLLHRESLRGVVMPPFCRFLGDLRYERRNHGGAVDPKRLAEIGLIPPASRFQLEDHFAGSWRELPWEMVELRVLREGSHTKTGGRSTRTVYRGLLIRIGLPMAFQGLVVLTRDFGSLGNQLAQLVGAGRSLQPLEVSHPAFELVFEVLGDGQANLPEFLTPPVMEALLQLDGARGGKGLTAAFADGALTLALPVRRDLFEFGSLFRSVYGVADDLHELLFQATLPRRIIDALHGSAPARVL